MAILSSQIPTKHMVPMCRQLATSYKAGIPVIRALELGAANADYRDVREALRGMADQVRAGATLAEAAMAQGKRLPPMFIQLLNAGEHGGRLDQMLEDLASYYEDRLEIGRTVAVAMFYPSLQLAAAWFLGTFALRLVRRLNVMSTERFELTAYLRDYGLFQLKALAVFAVIVLICWGLARVGALKWVTGWVSTHVWPIKKVTRKFALSRFFRSMSLLIGSGLNIKQCIVQSAATTTNPYIQRDLLKAVPYVADGATLTQAFSVTRSLTPMAREMLTIGETSGELETSLRKVSEYHLEEAKAAVRMALVALGVAILLLVALLIGYIVISFWTQFYGGMLDQIDGL